MHLEALLLRDNLCLDVPTYRDRSSGKNGKLSVRTETQGAIASTGWVGIIGNAFGLMKLE